MSRENSLVTAQWVEDNLDTDGIVLVEVDEDTTAYDKGHIRGAIKLDWTTDLQDQVRRDFVEQGAVRGAAVRARVSQRRHRRALRRQQQLVRRLRLLVLQALRPPGRQAARRRPQEVGARLPRADRRPARAVRPRRRTPPPSRTARIRAFRDESVAAIGTQNLVDVRSPDEYAGRLLAPAHLPQEQAQRAGHIPTAINVPWSKAANDDGTFKSDDELRELYADAGLDDSQGHHRLLPHRRALLAHLVRAARSCSATRTSRTTTARGPSTAPCRRPGRPRRRAGRPEMCGATEGGLSLDGVDVAKETVIQGQVLRGRGAGGRGLRAPARPHRRVHRRGADVGHRSLPLLRR